MVRGRTFSQIVRETNKRLQGGTASLYYDAFNGQRVRLMRLRTKGGVLEGKRLHDGRWIYVYSGGMVWL